jgi:serine protease Do
MVKEVLPQLYARGSVKRGWIGASVQDLTTDQARKVGARSMAGVLVSEVIEGGPAARAGLRPGDVILGLDANRVDRAHSLRWKVANAGVGHEVELKVARRGKPMKVKVRLEDLPAAEEGTDGGLARASTKPVPQKGHARP